MIIYAGDVLVERLLRKLFYMCLIHGFVPNSFGQSVIVPVLKDKNSNAGCCDNYRPISLTTIFSKVFELCLSKRVKKFSVFDELQFGFVPGKGCQKALFTVETVVNYYTSRGSPVFMASLNAAKAFDRVNHYALFNKLIEYWYSSLCS